MWQTKTTIRLGMLSILLIPFAVIGVKLGLWPFRLGFLLMAVSGLVGVLGVIWGLSFVFRERFAVERSHIFVGIMLALSPVLLLVALFLFAASKPVIHDVSTNWQNPPLFNVLLEQRGAKANSLALNDEVIALQQAHYPHIKTIESDLSVAQAKEKALKVASHLNWSVVDDSKPNVIEATFTSSLFGFVDDIVIRIRASNGGSHIDLRSVSRVGQSDLGANAARIAAFSDLFLQ